MKKAIICILLAATMTVVDVGRLAGTLEAAVRSRLEQRSDAPQSDPLPTFSEHIGSVTAHDMLDVTLYFRYADTGLLSAQRAQLDIRREETIATAIVERLLEGPEAASERMDGLFPKGTRLVSVSGEGTTAFVTLSREFLGKPDGAPNDWEDLTVWQSEAALRRMLAVQSLVLSLTEDGRFQRVQLYVADNDDAIPERVPLVYFSPDEENPDVVLAACSRDESYLLTPQRVLLRILACWQKKDWTALYDMISAGESAMPMREVFKARMQELNVSLLEYQATAGSVSYDGQRATLVVTALIRTPDGGEARIDRASVPLSRENGQWTMTADTLLSLMVRD